MILKYVCCDQSVADYMYLILTQLSKRRTSRYSPLSRDAFVNAAKHYLRSQRGNTETTLQWHGYVPGLLANEVRLNWFNFISLKLQEHNYHLILVVVYLLHIKNINGFFCDNLEVIFFFKNKIHMGTFCFFNRLD